MTLAMRMSAAVRRRLGRDAAALDAGVGMPLEVQCWKCGGGINTLAARPGAISLSAITVGEFVNLPAFGHAEHAESRLFASAEEFRGAASTAPSPNVRSEADVTLLVDGQRAEDVVQIEGRPWGEWLDAAARAGEPAAGDPAGGAGDDDAGARAAAGGDLLRSVRCPACGQLPDSLIGPTQAVCGNPDCRALLWNPLRSAAEQLADEHQVNLTRGDGSTADLAQMDAGLDLPVPPRRDQNTEPVGSVADAEHERWARGVFHEWGYRCADGCPHCA